MQAITTNKGVTLKVNDRDKCLKISWEDLPEVVSILQNIAQQRATDLRVAAEAAAELEAVG